MGGSSGFGSSIPSPSQWLGRITTGGAISPASGLGYFLDKVVPFAISIMLFIIIVLSLIFTLVGGLQWILSSGNKEGLTKAKGTLTWALLGLAFGIGAFFLLTFIFGAGIVGK